ncbi:MAG: hypothetical protein WCI27_04180 [Candidatus Omnitrophota bacterium]
MKKTFDCVEMKNQCAQKVRQMIGAVSIKQELAFWKKRAEALKSGVQRTKTATT